MTGKYFASVLVEDGLAAPEKPAPIPEDGVIGIDLGLSHYLSDSNGRKEDNPRHLKKALANLRRKQRKLSRKEKGTRRRQKARLLVAKAHERVTDARNDFQHKLSRRLVDENQAVVFESLNIKGMLKNGTLARHISDASWHSFVSKVEYKAERAGRHFVQVSPWFASSKTCSSCGGKAKAMPLSIRSWACSSCGSVHDRDLNAATNIKDEGIRILLAGGLSVTARGGRRNPIKRLVVATVETRSLAIHGGE